MNKVLVIAAHPDDELLGVGGTIRKHVKAGDEVYSVILGEGQTSRWEDRENTPKEILDSLNKDSLEAAAILGIKKSYFATLPDNRFDNWDLLDVVKEVEKVIDLINPDIIYTHFEEDLNVDHRITHAAVLTATRPMADCGVREIYAYETLSATEWNFTARAFKPNYYVDITDEIEDKIKAMDAYKSELKTWPHPRSLEGIRTLAKYRGMQVGMEYAEGFQVVRILNK